MELPPDDLKETPAPNGSVESRPVKPRRRSIWLAWLAITLTVVFAILPHRGEGNAQDDRPSIVVPEIQAKYLVGVASLGFTSNDTNREQIELVFGSGPLIQQLIGVVLIGDLVRPDQAIKSLEEIDGQIEDDSISVTDRDRELIELLRKTLVSRTGKNEETAALSEADEQARHRLFPEQLGWAGKLALAPPGSDQPAIRSALLQQARRTFFVMIGLFGVGIAAGLVGFVLEVVWWVFLSLGQIKSGIGPLRGDSVVYAETFAVWMALYLGLGFVVSHPSLSKLGLGAVAIAQVGSLAALAWPMIRGIRWNDVREDLGLTLGPQGWTVPFVGAGAYLSALPLVFISMLVTLAMMQFSHLFAGPGGGPIEPPVHPIVEPIIRGNWTVRLQLLFVAVFAAVPEEIMFRGVLYRHLRELGTRLGRVGKVIFAALTSSFIFAVIHPQGLFGIPILMTVAIVFAVVREWRGSIAPSMVTHALVNAGTSTILFLIAE